MNRPPRPPPAASVRVVRHDLPAPDQALHNGLHLLALILGFLVLPGIALAGVWYAWWPGSIGVPAAMASPVLSVFWSHLLRRNLLLDAAPVDAGRLRGSPCPPGLWRSIAGHLVRGGAGIPAWPGSHSAVGRFVEEAFAPQRSNASAVVWHDDHAVLIWHRPDGAACRRWCGLATGADAPTVGLAGAPLPPPRGALGGEPRDGGGHARPAGGRARGGRGGPW